MVFLNIPRWSLFFHRCLFFWCFIGFFFFRISLICCGRIILIFSTIFGFYLLWILPASSTTTSILSIIFPSLFFSPVVHVHPWSGDVGYVHEITRADHFPKSFIITLISFTSGRVSKEKTFIYFGFKLAKFLSVLLM